MSASERKLCGVGCGNSAAETTSLLLREPHGGGSGDTAAGKHRVGWASQVTGPVKTALPL